MSMQAVRGMKDVLAPEVYKFQFIEAAARRVFDSFGFCEIKTPVLERTELFARSIGETTDIVEKEMYTFNDRSGEMLTMRPEATAGVLRAFLEHKLHALPGPSKLFTIGPMFRHERPQKGRLRQFHQLNAEVLGDEGPFMDAEMMVMLAQLLESLGLGNVNLVLNSLGCPVCRPSYRQALTDFLDARRGALCPDCQRRLASNPLRVLDCKVEGCKEATVGAPFISQHWCPDCVEHFQTVQSLLAASQVEFSLDPRLVRGLDYYTRTTFEAKAGDLGAQDAVAGGGRYDGLAQQLGGPPTPCIGFACGMERLALLLDDPPGAGQGPELFVAALGDAARAWTFPRLQRLRRAGHHCQMSSQAKGLKAQMKAANRLGAGLVAIIGDSELEQEKMIIRDMASSAQTEAPLALLESDDLAPLTDLVQQRLRETGE